MLKRTITIVATIVECVETCMAWTKVVWYYSWHVVTKALKFQQCPLLSALPLFLFFLICRLFYGVRTNETP